MSRPKPRLILEHIQEDLRGLQIVEADAIYAVFYGDQPIGIKANRNVEIPNWQGWKYMKSSFPNPGHAFNLAERLNERFATDLFNVRIMVPGRRIQEKIQ